MNVQVHVTYCPFIFFMEMERQKMAVFVVKRYAVCTAKIGRYAVRKWGGGVTLILGIYIKH